MLKPSVQKLNAFAIKHHLYLAAAVLEACGILVLSVIPNVGGGINSGVVAHGCAYGILSFTIALSCRASAWSYPIIAGAFFAGAFGTVIELIQFLIPYRNCEAGDLVINCCGAGLAMVPGGLLRNKGWI